MEPAIPLWLPPLAAAPFVGSFLGTVIARYPRGRPLLLGRSCCPRCGHPLGAADLVPLLSWMASFARCRHCRGRISVLYPAIELAALLVAAWSVLVLPGWIAWAGCALGWTLLTLAAIDQRWFWLPHALTVPLLLAGLAVAWVLEPASLVAHLAGASAGWLAFTAVAAAYRRLRGGEGLGGGDAWLLAALGAWVGWPGLPTVVVYACLSGLLWVAASSAFGRRLGLKTRIPFGPHLCLGGWLVWLYGPLAAG
jgi:leader peptidase (prepilin peptidase)/N-methyltransferase